jgi:hypothetical protein
LDIGYWVLGMGYSLKNMRYIQNISYQKSITKA